MNNEDDEELRTVEPRGCHSTAVALLAVIGAIAVAVLIGVTL